MAEHIHFVGIGGAGLSALAQVMLGRGFEVSGSDPTAPSATTNYLEKLGARIYSGHDAKNIEGAGLVVVTSAAQSDNPEITAAHLQQIRVLKRREFLREVTRENDVIAVAGSHGKTTTTAMIALTLADAGRDPTVVVGGTVPEWETNARSGKSRWFVIEADEYDYAFLGLEPKVAVVTNVDYDHPDLFSTRQVYAKAFGDFLKQTRRHGVIVACGDDAGARTVATDAGAKVIFYGMGAGYEWRATNVQSNGMGGTDFAIEHAGRMVGTAVLAIPGEHNVVNALAAVAAASQAGVEVEDALRTLARFTGVGRRFQIRGTFNGATLVDDYAHHPTEIRVNLKAARRRFPGSRIWALFQPHTFSRTQALRDEFATAFEDADRVIITEVYAAREKDETGISSREIVQRMAHPNVRYVATLWDAENILRKELQPVDVLLAFGAGNVNQVTDRLLEAISK